MGAFVHMELNTSDPKAAKAFYKGVFGWKVQDMKMPDGVYSMLMDAQGGGIGGIAQNPDPNGAPGWLGYIGVESLKRTITKIEKRGGKIMMGATEVPGMGTFAVFLDPQGAPCAVWEHAPVEKKGKKKAAKKKAAKKKAAKKKTAKKKTAKKKTTKKK